MIVEANSPLYRHALQIFHSMWETTGKNGRLPPIFPGPQPISIERVHFAKLKSNPYVVCEKTDGVRIVLLAFLFENKKVTLLINRSLQMTQISLNLPKSAHRGTLLDGELVEKTLMIYDGVWVSGEDIKQKNFLDRLEKIELFIRGIMRLAKDPIMVRLKKFVTLNELENFQKNVDVWVPMRTCSSGSHVTRTQLTFRLSLNPMAPPPSTSRTEGLSSMSPRCPPAKWTSRGSTKTA
jgi:hypothetical protein